MHWLRDVAIFLALAWLLLVALTTARAQEPTPTVSTCVGIETEGGQTTVHGPIQVTLPEGDFTRTIAPPNTPPYGWRFCHVETGASILISDTCEEVSREAATAEGDAILDAIIDSCVVVPPNVPPPGVEDCPAGGVPLTGGQTYTLFDAVNVTLPEGQFIVTPGQEDVVQICRVGGSPTFALSLVDCHRVDIAPPNAPDADIVQAIVESCTPLNPPPDSTTAPLTPNPNIQPPNTGNGGLLN